MLLDERYAWKQEPHPRELYNLTKDQQEQDNLVDTPAAKPARDFLVEQAHLASGDKGSSRQLQRQSLD